MVKNLPANARDVGDSGSISRSGRSPGVGNGNPLQYFCLGNYMDRGAWWATVRTESNTTVYVHKALLYTYSRSTSVLVEKLQLYRVVY